MKKITNFIVNNLHWIILAGVSALCAVFILVGTPNEEGYYTVGGDITISEGTDDFIKEAKAATIEYSKTAVPTIITNENGEEEIIEAPTVELIDGGELQVEKCPEGEECGLGAYVYAPTDTYEHFKDYTIGKCWNVDGAYGAQCWDLGALFWMNYTTNGRSLDTCGTGAARGAWDCKEKNAGTEFDLIYDKTKVKKGDWIITSGGKWGHVCEAAGPYNNGYVACLGQNQGGSSCPGGGAATNIINLSLSTFSGAFRPKTYEEPDPTPTPTPVSDCKKWTLTRGDTLGKIMLVCEGKIEWGEKMNNYAKTWVDESTGKTVFDGWTNYPWIGLYAGHTIVRK